MPEIVLYGLYFVVVAHLERIGTQRCACISGCGAAVVVAVSVFRIFVFHFFAPRLKKVSLTYAGGAHAVPQVRPPMAAKITIMQVFSTIFPPEKSFLPLCSF